MSDKVLSAHKVLRHDVLGCRLKQVLQPFEFDLVQPSWTSAHGPRFLVICLKCQRTVSTQESKMGSSLLTHRINRVQCRKGDQAIKRGERNDAFQLIKENSNHFLSFETPGHPQTFVAPLPHLQIISGGRFCPECRHGSKSEDGLKSHWRRNPNCAAHPLADYYLKTQVDLQEYFNNSIAVFYPLSNPNFQNGPIYFSSILPSLVEKSQHYRLPHLSENLLTPFLRHCRWHEHLSRFLLVNIPENSSELFGKDSSGTNLSPSSSPNQLIDLKKVKFMTSLINVDIRTRSDEDRWMDCGSRESLSDITRAYMEWVYIRHRDANWKIKLLMHGGDTQDNARAWETVETPSRDMYALVMQKLALAILYSSTVEQENRDPLQFQLLLPEEDRKNSAMLIEALKKGSSSKIDPEDFTLELLHRVIKPLLYPAKGNGQASISHQRWEDPLEIFIALAFLKDDGTYAPISSTTPFFAAFKYIIRCCVFFESFLLQKESGGSIDLESIVSQEASKNFNEASNSRFNIVTNYQNHATSQTFLTEHPPRLRFSKDRESVNVKGITLNLKAWRDGIKALIQETQQDVERILDGWKSPFDLGVVVEDNLQSQEPGYSWVRGVLLPIPKKELLCSYIFPRKFITDQATHGRSNESNMAADKFKLLNQSEMDAFLADCWKITHNLALLTYFTSGPPLEVKAFADLAYANGEDRSYRNMYRLAADNALWIVSFQHTRTHGKPIITPRRLPPRVARLMELYLCNVRPVETAIFHLRGNKNAARKLEHYLWVKSGEMVSQDLMAKEIELFFKNYAQAKGMNATKYTLFANELACASGLLASEGKLVEMVHRQMGHSPQMALEHYARDIDQLPEMFAHKKLSEEWWILTGTNS